MFAGRNYFPYKNNNILNTSYERNNLHIKQRWLETKQINQHNQRQRTIFVLLLFSVLLPPENVLNSKPT